MSHVKITAILNARPGKAQQLEALLRDLAKSSRREAGNLRWDIWQDRDNPARFVLDELYVDAAAVLAHREAPHFLSYAAKVGELADRTAYVSLPVSVVG